MDIEIRKLTPGLAEDYARFFDVTPHDDNKEEHKCYCVCWCSDDSEGKDFSSREKRREHAVRYVGDGSIQGYLAYRGDEIVGWCNANTKSDCLKCAGWREINGPRKGFIPVEDAASGLKVKSVFCFAVAPEMKRQGVATRLLERVCGDAVRDGFDFVEAYPNKVCAVESEGFGGYKEMYQKSGFSVCGETKKQLIMRKPLK